MSAGVPGITDVAAQRVDVVHVGIPHVGSVVAADAEISYELGSISSPSRPAA
jgi:hypothetical protein